jgi:sugar transferase (PEP-CTERM/EpsH1 system associated)
MTSGAGHRREGLVRVLHVVDSLAPGGTELAAAALIERTEDQFDHAVCSLRGSGLTADNATRLAVPISFLDKRHGHDWGLPLRIARLCRRLRPQVVHARNWGTTDAVIGARLAGVPVVIQSEHGRELNDLEGQHRARLRVRRLLTPFIDMHVAVSTHLQRWLLDCVGVRPEKVRVVRNGVDASRFQPLPQRDLVRAQHGYGTADLVFGSLGRLTPVKDHPSLLEAFQTVLTRYPQSRLIMVGDGPERGALEDQVRRRGLADRVRLVGHRDDVAQWLGIMDVFVHASLVEGMSNAVLEAMAVGLPVVATAVGGTPEVVEPHVTGLLVPPATPDALASAMMSYGGNPHVRAVHGAAGRERAAKHFPVMKMVEGYADVYRHTLARCGRAIEYSAQRATDS